MGGGPWPSPSPPCRSSCQHFTNTPELPLVGVSRLLVVLVRLAQHQDVVAPPEGVRVDLDWVQVGVGVGALSLVGRAPVIVPDGQIVNTIRFRVQGLCLVPDALASTVNPDVTSLDPTGKFSLRF